MENQSRFNQLLQWIAENESIVPSHLHNLSEFGGYHAPICSRCQIAMRISVEGIYVIATYNDPPEPYEIWMADEYQCPICEVRAVNRFSNNATKVHEDHFESALALAREELHVYALETIKQANYFLYINSQDLIPGKWADIYQKPLTGEMLEGRAKLVKKIGNDSYDPAVQRWMVMFSDDILVERTIYTLYANASLEL